VQSSQGRNGLAVLQFIDQIIGRQYPIVVHVLTITSILVRPLRCKEYITAFIDEGGMQVYNKDEHSHHDTITKEVET
jgi:hypothetical protein